MDRRIALRAAALALAFVAAPAAAQVLDYGKYPDFRGQWARQGRPNNWIQLAGPPPLTPEYQKIWEDIKADYRNGGGGNWGPTFCIPSGMPAMMNLYDPMEIIITPSTTYILISHDDDSYRRIYTDGRDWPAEPAPSFAGYSIGKWIDEDGDGKYDVLEVETRHMKLPRSYDVDGVPFHADGKAVVRERLYLDKANRNLILNDITVIDNALLRPWSKQQKGYRNPDPRPVWESKDCAQNNTHVRIGAENYVISGDGKLMPARKGQQPPDLVYFGKQ